MQQLKQISPSEVKNLIPDLPSEELKYIQQLKESIFLVKRDLKSATKTDPLIRIEISLRRCKRLGVFQK